MVTKTKTRVSKKAMAKVNAKTAASQNPRMKGKGGAKPMPTSAPKETKRPAGGTKPKGGKGC